LFAVFYVASLFGVLDIPDGSDSDAAVQAAFVDDRGQIRVVPGECFVRPDRVEEVAVVPDVMASATPSSISCR
jgi:hypothetical protein